MSFIYGEELHPPYYNFMGPRTKIEDRISLNYKRKGQGPLGIKKGTLSFWIPSTVSDLVSLEHDLMYYSPNNYIKALADWNYLKHVESDIGTLGIGIQFIRRFGIESIPMIMKAEALRKAFLKSLETITKLGKDAFTAVQSERKLTQRAVDEVLEPFNNANNIWNELTGRRIDLFENLDLDDIRRFPAQQQLIIIMKELLKTAPYFIAYAGLGYDAIVPKIKNIYNQMSDYVYKTDEYKQMKPYLNDIKDNLQKYLDEVGSFKDPKDLPLSKKLYHFFFTNFDRTFEVFDIDKIDRKKAEKYYTKYFKAFEKYAKFMNDRHQGDPNYEPFNLKPLNIERLPMVSSPTGLTTENLNNMVLFNQTVNDYMTDIISKKKGISTEEFKDEIIKVLAGEQPAIGVSFDIPDEDFNFENTLPSDEEILKILEGEQTEPEMTLIQEDIQIPEIEFTDYF